MRQVFNIARKELYSNFVTPVAYVVSAGFMILSGFFFFGLLRYFNSYVYQMGQDPLQTNIVPSLNEWVIEPYYHTLEVVLLFLIPILTMRSFAEEKSSGTFELLATSPVSVGEIVLGKFFGACGIATVMLLLSFVYPLVLIAYTEVEVPPILLGFLGLWLFAASCVSFGLACSASAKSQTVAGVVALVVLLLIYVIDAPSGKVSEEISAVLRYLAPGEHTELLARGVLDGSDLVYFGSFILIGLFITNRFLDAERWR